MLLNRVLIKVDFPRPDSPRDKLVKQVRLGEKRQRTDDHGSELEALPDALPMDLVGQVGKAYIAHELLANSGGLAKGRGRRGGGDGGAIWYAGWIAGRARGVRVRHLGEE